MRFLDRLSHINTFRCSSQSVEPKTVQSLQLHWNTHMAAKAVAMTWYAHHQVQLIYADLCVCRGKTLYIYGSWVEALI